MGYGPDFEGEHIGVDSTFLECGGQASPMVEWVITCSPEEVEDGKTDIIGPDLDLLFENPESSLAICIKVSGKLMRDDFETVLERQIHRFLNYIQGVQHTRQRDRAILKISREAVIKGLRLKHIGLILMNGLRREYSLLFDKIQVSIYSVLEDVQCLFKEAQAIFRKRDSRIEKLSDEDTPVFYSCIICQSVSPKHVCIITPEQTGMCGVYNWLDCQVSSKINPYGPIQPVSKGQSIDINLGRWQGLDNYITRVTGGNIKSCSLYSLTDHPLPSSKYCECITAVLPQCNGIMVVDRGFSKVTPSGMSFRHLKELMSYGVNTPGFIGHSKFNLTQKNFIKAEGGLLRLVWMPSKLKADLTDKIDQMGEKLGCPRLANRIADDNIGLTEQSIHPFLADKQHPALGMPPIIG